MLVVLFYHLVCCIAEPHSTAPTKIPVRQKTDTTNTTGKRLELAKLVRSVDSQLAVRLDFNNLRGVSAVNGLASVHVACQYN